MKYWVPGAPGLELETWVTAEGAAAFRLLNSAQIVGTALATGLSPHAF